MHVNHFANKCGLPAFAPAPQDFIILSAKKSLPQPAPTTAPIFFVQLNARKPFCHQTPPAFAPAYAGLSPPTPNAPLFYAYFPFIAFLPTAYPNHLSAKCGSSAFAPQGIPTLSTKKAHLNSYRQQAHLVRLPLLKQGFPSRNSPLFTHTFFYLWHYYQPFLKPIRYQAQLACVAPSGFPENCPLHS